MRWPCVAALVVLSCSLARPARAQEWDASDEPSPGPSHVWALGGAGFGGGSERLGPMHLAWFVHADFWAIEPFAVDVSAGRFGAGAPDERQSEGSFVAGGVGYRLRLPSPEETWFFAALDAGSATASGFDDPVRREQSRFDVAALTIMPRSGVIVTWPGFAIGGELSAAIVPGQGVAVFPCAFAGIAF
jgi:hypothetical protein